MKRLLLYTFVFLLSSFNTYSQWVNQNSVPDGNVLWSTFFVDDNTGWIVGSDGLIKKTTDAGDEWIFQNSGATSTLKSVTFVDQNNGWICGEGGLILSTTNGGANWEVQLSGTTEHLSDIYFYDTNIGYAVGFGGTIIKTTNGGSSWTNLSSGTTNDLYSMDFVDAFIGYAAGEVNDTSSVIKTTDGGASWIDKSSGFPATSRSCFAVEFIDATTGFIGGSTYYFYKTTDGGDTWIEFNTPSTSGHVKSIYFKDANNGWYSYWTGNHSHIYGTTNCGITWERKYQADDERPFLSVFVTENGTGWAVGENGFIGLKENSSSDWLRLFSGVHDDIHSVYFVDENIGWAGGTRLGNPSNSVVLKTTNGGKQWKTQLVMNIASYSRCFYFLNRNELFGWFVRSNRTPKELVGAGIHRTTDGGETWENLGGGDYSSIFFINQDTGWVTSDNGGFSNGIYKSTDGGITLVKKSSISCESVYFSDMKNGWAVGVSGILKSTDGGETWINKSSFAGSHIKFFDSNVGMCVGGVDVLVSTDGGETWTSKSGPSLQSINFINSTTILGYTSEGTVYKTIDFGDSWASRNTGLGFGETAFFINEYTGWVGDGNDIYKYSTEPIPSILLSSPNGGEVWKSGWQRNITWTSENISNVNLYYSTNGGGDWNTIATNIDASVDSYTWTVPTLNWFLNFNCKVKIEDASNSSVYDESANNFIIWHFCNIIQYANLGQRIIDFLETNIDISMNVTTADNISVNFYPYESPVIGTPPAGIDFVSEYYWQVSSPAINFNNGKIIVPVSTLRGVTDASKLVWLKRTNPGDAWENIGGLVSGENLESTLLFNSFSEFAIGSTDDPLPVELSSFTATAKTDQIMLKWETKTETNNYGFDIEKKTNETWKKIGFVEGNGNSSSQKQYSFTDNKLIEATNFQYRLKQMDNDGKYEYSAVVEVKVVPTEYALHQNYPNPFNPTTTIRYQLPKESKVVIKIYNILGSEVMELLNENKEPGIYEVEFNASNLSSGTYIYKISADNFISVKKMLLVK